MLMRRWFFYCDRQPSGLGCPPLWAWRHERLHGGHHVSGDLGNNARTRAIPDARMVATPLILLAVAIGDERQSKEALRVSEERMGLAVESAQMALWDWDVANDKVWMTDEGRKFFGIDAGEPIASTRYEVGVYPNKRIGSDRLR